MAILPPDVQEALNKQVGKALRRDFEKEATIQFKKIKAELINEFLNKLKELMTSLIFYYINKPPIVFLYFFLIIINKT
jgi:hypothetical protein